MEIPVSNRAKLILAADDFGLDRKTNERILELVLLGKIDRVAIMTRGKMTEEEIEELRRSGVHLDIHLDISRVMHDTYKPRNGVFLRILEFVFKYIFGITKTSSVHMSWMDQIEDFHKKFGKYPDGLNSHEHVHFFPRYFHVARILQEHYSIPYMRFGNTDLLEHKNPVAKVLHILHKINKRSGHAQYVVSSDFLVSFDWIKDIKGFLANMPQGTIEVVCHPRRDEEYAALLENF